MVLPNRSSCHAQAQAWDVLMPCTSSSLGCPPCPLHALHFLHSLHANFLHCLHANSLHFFQSLHAFRANSLHALSALQALVILLLLACFRWSCTRVPSSRCRAERVLALWPPLHGQGALFSTKSRPSTCGLPLHLWTAALYCALCFFPRGRRGSIASHSLPQPPTNAPCHPAHPPTDAP